MTAQLSEIDLQHLRHLIIGYDTCSSKMQAYAN